MSRDLLGNSALRINPISWKSVFQPFPWWAETRDLKPNEWRSELLFDQVLAEVSTELLAVPRDDLNGEFGHGLQRVADVLDVDGLSVWETSEDGGAHITDGSVRLGIARHQEPGPEGKIPWILDRLLNGKERVAFGSLDDLPSEAREDRSLFERLGIAAALVVPFMSLGNSTGLLVATKINGPHVWPESLIPQLRLVSNIFGAALQLTNAKLTLRFEEKRFRQLAETAFDGIVVSRSDGTIAYANSQAETLFGYGPGALSGQALEALVPDSLRNPYDHPRGEYPAEPHMCCMRNDHSLRALRQDGSIFPVEVCVQELHTEEDRMLMSVIRDISHCKRVEEDLRTQRENLARITRGAAMGELTGALAHELNQPLTSILANAQAARRILRTGPPNGDELGEIIGDIIAADKRAGAVVHGIRRFLSREDSDRAVVDLNRIIEDAVSFLRSDMTIKQITIGMALAPTLPPVYGDQIQLQQVIINLVINAMDAMRDTKREDRVVRVKSDYMDGKGIEVSVSDSGHAIEESISDQVFQPFFSTKTRGMGMGLWITKSILEANGGDIITKNNPDGGATFSFTLPTARMLR